MMRIKGFFDKNFSEVIETFRQNFIERGEIGAALCVFKDRKKVIDVWGGFADPKRKTLWEESTLVPIFSTTKAIAAGCLAVCCGRGLFNYKDKVSDYWNEFSQNGKEEITIETLLQHRAGLSSVNKILTKDIIADRDLLENILAAQKPAWKPGDNQGYHVWNIGWFISALLSRLDPRKRRLKEFVEEEILSKISGEIRVGIDEEFDLQRIAKLKPFSKFSGILSMPSKFVIELFKPWSLSFRSMLNPLFVSSHSNFNKKEILKLEIGSGGGIGNARGLASFLEGLTDEQSPLFAGKETLEYIMEYPEPPTNGFQDVVFKEDAFRFHAGFMKPSERHNFSPSKKAFGGFGAGGSFVFCDPDRQLTVAYVMNKMSSEMMNMDRELAIRKAIYSNI